MKGLLGKKLGMISFFTESGAAVPGTVIEAGPCVITGVRTQTEHGYSAVQLGFLNAKESRVKKPELGLYKKLQIEPKRFLREFRDLTDGLNTGDVLTVSIFSVGEKLKVTGISKGRGFAGVIKRYGFGRPNQSHGTHEVFRGTGAISAHSYPARVFPGKKLPGRMGNERVSMLNLDVLAIDSERNLIIVKGAIPGANGSIVELRKMEA